ncbi:GNAT family N-acetyltransferase [Flavobacterium zepuense]|uniref:GNAT family N-acetyltransferase n=1 Tax=Flavobacterium zepuense TaxID=2593302 RepID=A0A552V4G7_9FLAO|nr:GNAT family N-acetyltransferase [Flavobacterium zepuense]TRW25329.1 GNAT family N-acetyltransferase [Flavobacterium zepuense]
MTIEKANSNDDKILTEITLKSKAYWGYSDEQIVAWHELLTITKSYIETRPVYKLVINDIIAGYYSFFTENEYTVRLDNLFILPEYIGKGLGRFLMDDFILRIAGTGVKKVILDADPNAELFYAKFGFVKIGKLKTYIKNRYLPVMELVF